VLMPWESISWLAPASRDRNEQKCSLKVTPFCQYTSWSGSQSWPRGHSMLRTHLPKALAFERIRRPVGSLCNHRKYASCSHQYFLFESVQPLQRSHMRASQSAAHATVKLITWQNGSWPGSDSRDGAEQENSLSKSP
jgi:hypothetical protein